MKRDRRSTLHSQSRDAALSSKRGAWRGQLVRSRAGRDKGQYYLVLADSEDGFVWLADGRKAWYVPGSEPGRMKITTPHDRDLFEGYLLLKQKEAEHGPIHCGD